MFLMFWGASTSPNGTKCSTRRRGTSAGEVNEFSPYSVCLTLGYSLLMPCASSGHIGFTPKRKKHFACCKIIHYRNSSPTELFIIVSRRSFKSWLRKYSDKRYKFSSSKKAAYVKISFVLACTAGAWYANRRTASWKYFCLHFGFKARF